jgi:hypothetical protein
MKEQEHEYDDRGPQGIATIIVAQAASENGQVSERELPQACQAMPE